jgi:putative ABC transport system permease protein
MGVIWNKIWFDLWHNKSRTVQVVLIVTMGAFAIGMIIAVQNSLAAGMAQVWHKSRPMMIGLGVDPPVDEDMLIALKRIPGVENVEGQLTGGIEWRSGPDQPWQPADLHARADYRDQTYARQDLVAGSWPQGETVAVCQGVQAKFGVRLGQLVTIRAKDREHVLKVTGSVYDNYILPPGLGGSAQFYVDRDQFDHLMEQYGFNLVTAAAPVYEEARVKAIADEMQHKLETAGVDSGGATPPEGNRYVDPSRHFIQDIIDPIFLLLGIMGVLATVLGLFLVYNTVNAIISQQVTQIGVMKAIGARTRDILLIYLCNALMYGVMALVLAIPLGALAGWALSNALLSAMDMPTQALAICQPAVVAQLAISLLAPLLASLLPIYSGARITVREAISTYGLSTGSSGLDRVLARLQAIPRTISLTISNTFRHKGRVVLTQITLVMSGLIFMMIMAANDSATYTFTDVLFSILNFNVTLQFERAVRIDQVEQLTRQRPDVQAVEMWAADSPEIRPAGRPRSDDDRVTLLLGVPLPTRLYGPQMRAGRWLTPADTQAVVLNEQIATDVGVGVGDWVTLHHGVKGDSTWRVVGLLFDPILTTAIYAPRTEVLRVIRSVDRARTVWIQTVRKDATSVGAAATQLRQFYKDHHLHVSPSSVFGPNGNTDASISASVLGRFGIIMTLLLSMALLIGLVGSIALSGVLSLNVLERRREIGVMRAIGASSGTISGLFIGEGVILGWLSWVIATPLSLPAGQLMTQALGKAIGGSLVYRFTPTGVLLWLVIITVMAVAASFLPARGASRVSVRESLAYQ